MPRDKKIPMTVHLPADVVAALKDEQFGDTFSNVVTDRVRQALKMGPRLASPASPMDELELRKKTAEVEVAERRAGIMRREFVNADAMMAFVVRELGDIKSRVKQIPHQISNLTPEQLDDANKAVQDCFTDLSSEKKATWDDLADDAARNPP
jgi:hypothetical protein